jgi:predicted nicotinamide N-methyase
LTGQIVWPAAKVMSWFISTHQNEFDQKFTLELGAGTGLAGFVASQISERTIITDGNEVSL